MHTNNESALSERVCFLKLKSSAQIPKLTFAMVDGRKNRHDNRFEVAFDKAECLHRASLVSHFILQQKCKRFPAALEKLCDASTRIDRRVLIFKRRPFQFRDPPFQKKPKSLIQGPPKMTLF